MPSKKESTGSKKAKAPRAKSAFIFFSGEERARVLKDNPGLGFGDVGREVGKRWKALAASARRKYEEMAAEDKGRVGSSTKKGSTKKGSTKKGRTKKSSSKKGSAKKSTKKGGKRPRTAYIHFFMEERPNVLAKKPHLTITEVAREVGKRWRALTAEQQKPYQQKAAREKASRATIPSELKFSKMGNPKYEVAQVVVIQAVVAPQEQEQDEDDPSDGSSSEGEEEVSGDDSD